MYGAPPVCLNQSPGHLVQCAAMASQPAQSEARGRGAPGSASASPCPRSYPFSKALVPEHPALEGGGGPSFK